MNQLLEQILLKQNSSIIAVYNRDHKIPECSYGFSDVLFDFSHPSYLEKYLNQAIKYHLPCVIGTSNFSGHQMDLLLQASLEIPIIYEANYSIGFYMLKKCLANLLPLADFNFDFDIIEKHHRDKLDAISGSANELLRICNYFAHVHSLRSGNVSGEHQIQIAGEDEVIELSHRSMSKRVYALGAIKAAQFLIQQSAGFYTMEDVLYE